MKNATAFLPWPLSSRWTDAHFILFSVSLKFSVFYLLFIYLFIIYFMFPICSFSVPLSIVPVLPFGFPFHRLRFSSLAVMTNPGW